MTTSPLRRHRVLSLAAILTTIPAIFLVDIYLTPWRVPTTILFAIPVMVAARLLGPTQLALTIVAAMVASIADGWIEGVDIPTEVLSNMALAAIAGLSVLWARAERRSTVLAEEQRRLLALEKQRRAELEESRARLLEFFSMVAHDLRNPLTAILGFAQLVPRLEQLDPARREGIARSLSSAVQRLSRLAGDLQDAARIGSGRFAVDKGGCDLVALSREIVELRKAASAGHHLVLEARVERLEGCYDKDRLGQALGNLVDNAIKYSPNGGEVRVLIERNDTTARICVKDQGLGMAPEDVGRLFQPYSRLKQASGIKGLGLGLHIVKGIVEAHGGAISADSELGEGTAFNVELPLEEPC